MLNWNDETSRWYIRWQLQALLVHWGWKIIEEWINLNISDRRERLEDMANTEAITNILRLQIKFLKELLVIPERLINDNKEQDEIDNSSIGY